MNTIALTRFMTLVTKYGWNIFQPKRMLLISVIIPALYGCGAGTSDEEGGTTVTTTTQTQLPTVNFSASPLSIATGETTTLTWSSTNATNCTASGGWSGTKATSGNESSGVLTTTTAFTLTCSNGTGNVSRNVTVSVSGNPAPTVMLTANPTAVTAGQSSQLTWSASNANSCTASGAWSGSKATSGSQSTGAINTASTYTLSCTGNGGTTDASVTINVGTPAPTVTLTANPTAVTAGQSSQLTWNASNATSCTASGAWSGSKATSGSQSTGAINTASTYTLSCTGNGGTTDASVTVNIGTPAPTVDLTASPTSVNAGETSALSWTTNNATTCTASGAWAGSKGTSGSQTTAAITANSTFTLTCNGAGGTGQDSATVSINVPAGEPGATITTHQETIPNPVFGSTFRVSAACKGVQTPCAWESTSTWNAGSIPTANTRVIVDGNVMINGTSQVLHVGVYPDGKLSFNPSANTKLSTGDLIVFPGGTLTIGTEQQPIAANVLAEVEIRDLPFSNDPKQHLRTLLVVDGTIRIQGRTVSAPFIKTSAEISANSLTVSLEKSATAGGWRVGDTISVPKSSQCLVATYGTCASETEERTISAISGNGLTLTLSSPLFYDHPGARDANGAIRFLPYVLNKTRNVLIHSENPSGIRGHIMLHGRADAMVRYAMIRDMGRTNINDLGTNNQKGRYPLHAHHLIGPVAPQSNGRQFTFEGNVIDFGNQNYTQNRKWGLTIHGSHYGLIKGNIVDRASGAAIVTESGEESYNQFYENFAVRVIGGTGERLHDPDPGDGSKLGRAGVGYWFNGGGLNSIRNNVAADIAECIYCYGFKFDNVYNSMLMIPKNQGDMPMQNGVMLDPYEVPIDDFIGNETYSTPNGLTIWWVCAEFETPHDNCASTVVDFNVWHFHRWGYFGYEVNQLTIDGFVARGDPSVLNVPYESVTGLWFGDYMQRKVTIQNADLQGLDTGIELPSHRDVRRASGSQAGLMYIRDSVINAATGLSILPAASVNGSNDLAPMRTIVDNVDFSYPGSHRNTHITIRSNTFDGGGTPNQSLRNDVVVCDYDGLTGDDFYFIPDYQGQSYCDSSMGNCVSNISGSYPDIKASRVFPATNAACSQ